MAIISRELRLLFVLAPHTGSTAIADLLRADLGGEWLPPEEIRGEDGRVLVRRKHTTVAELFRGGVLTREERAGLLVFSAVRNPFDTLVSVYLKHSVKDQVLLERPDSWVHGHQRKLANLEYCRDHTFHEWIEHMYAPRWLDRLRRRSRKPRWLYDRDVDVVMRYERLQEDFDAVLRRAGVTNHHEIPQLNVTAVRGARDYREFYAPRSRKLVEEAYTDFLRRYDYAY